MTDPELEFYKDGCLAERERADQAEDELERIREAMGADDDSNLVSLAATLRRRDERCAEAHGELQHDLLRAEAMLRLAWMSSVEPTGQTYESWLAALMRQLEETI